MSNAQKFYCIFTGSSRGADARYMELARRLGETLARTGHGVVYGGASIGLMGAVADGCLAAGGPVVGVLPKALAGLEIAHEGLTELHIVEGMHARKAMMAARSDGFIALPGGLGTLEELFEIWTWAQLGEHAKPVALLNAFGFYDELLSFLAHVEREGFVRGEHRAMLVTDDDPLALLDKMAAYEAPKVDKLVREEDL